MLIDETEQGLVFLVVLVVIALTVLIGFIKRVATTYTITDRRLNIKRGLISREIQETRLERVQNVNYRQSAIQRMLRVGDVDFDTAAGDDYNFVFNGVADPSDVVHRVDVATGQGGTTGLGDEHTSPGGTAPAPAGGEPARRSGVGARAPAASGFGLQLRLARAAVRAASPRCVGLTHP